MKVLCLLPASDYDPTESAVPWQVLTEAGHDVWFATPSGEPGYADSRLVDIGFGALDPVLMTRSADLAAYRRMIESARFRAPLAYEEVIPSELDALLIPGGHAQGMRTMIESPVAQAICAHFFAHAKPVGAICHGVLLLARTLDRATGRSVLRGRETTCLTDPMELGAWLLTAPVLGRYYRTYPRTVESEVRTAVGDAGRVHRGPLLSRRDDAEHPSRGFVVRDGAYVSARWPGDAHRFAATLRDVLASTAPVAAQPSA